MKILFIGGTGIISTACAELAVTVLDRYQRQGLGLILLAALSRFAAERDVSTFVSFVDAERRGLLRTAYARIRTALLRLSLRRRR